MEQFGNGGINLKRKKPLPWVNPAVSTSSMRSSEYTPRQAAYDLKKLRGKDWLINPGGSRRYRATPQGLRTMAALVTLLDKGIKPLLAGTGKLTPGQKPNHDHAIDRHYEAIQREMQGLFDTLGIAA